MCVAIAIGALPCASVEAQPAPPTPSGEGWEVEVHGGGIIGSTPDRGDFAMPALNDPVPPNFYRPVPSWYFGDGSFQLNQFLSARQSAPINALDGTLQSRIATRRAGGAFGARVSRRIVGRLSAEFAIDYTTGALALTNEAQSALEATRASFIPALNAFFTGGLITSRMVNSTLTTSEEDGAQIVTIGAVRFEVMGTRNWAPYVVAGVGMLSIVGDGPRAELTGTYQAVLSLPNFSVPPSTLSQTDRVIVTSTVEPSAVWVLGGGVRFWMSEKWGIRIDVRDHMQSNAISTRVSTAPLPPPATFGAYITSILSTPPIAFSGGTVTGSTLSVPLSDVVTFTGKGVTHQVGLTTGFAWRF